MATRSILIQYQDEDRGTWCLHWSDTLELADPRTFSSIEDAGAAANVLLAQAGLRVVGR